MIVSSLLLRGRISLREGAPGPEDPLDEIIDGVARCLAAHGEEDTTHPLGRLLHYLGSGEVVAYRSRQLERAFVYWRGRCASDRGNARRGCRADQSGRTGYPWILTCGSGSWCTGRTHGIDLRIRRLGVPSPSERASQVTSLTSHRRRSRSAVPWASISEAPE